MKKKTSKKPVSKNKIIWLSVLILFICVSLTTLAFVDIFNAYLMNDKGAISLIPSGSSQNGRDPSDVTDPSNNIQSPEPDRLPNLEFSDNSKVWTTNTEIGLFKLYYENGQRVISVLSDNGDKLITPGTENSYTFKLKNTGHVAMDYTVEIDAYFAPSDITIPITARVSRYDGKWVIGGKNSYDGISSLNNMSDSGTVGVAKFVYYTIDWKWPFESDNDELDTLLGTLANEEELTFTIVIKTTATICSDPDADGGILPPQTGDTSNLLMWITLSICSFMFMLFLILKNEKEKRRNEAEAYSS